MKNNRSFATLAVATLFMLPLIAQATPPPPVVPEPSTIVAGALLLVPLGAGIARAWRNRK